MSLHSSVDFSSVYVVINLQTWVILFDYLGIGVPTPPPSRPSSAEPPGGTLSNFEPPPSLRIDAESTLTGQSVAFMSALDESLLQDAIDFSSLGSELASGGNLQRQSSSGVNLSDIAGGIPTGLDVGEDSLTSGMSSKEGGLGVGEQRPPVGGAGATPTSTVWGVEGKLSAAVSLNVKSLTVTFNKPEHPLARGNVSSLSAELEMNKGNLKISGSLGQASVIDLTKTGAFYRERYGKGGGSECVGTLC